MFYLYFVNDRNLLIIYGVNLLFQGIDLWKSIVDKVIIFDSNGI